MKFYYFSVIAIVLAIGLSAFTRSIFTTYRFKLKSGTDLTSHSAVENKLNWQQTSLICDSVPDISCVIIVDEQFTHIEGSPFQIRVLNITGSNVISIQSENGIFDTAPNPDVQYLRIAAGINYIFVNTRLE
jgi:hypothetical protein